MTCILLKHNVSGYPHADCGVDKAAFSKAQAEDSPVYRELRLNVLYNFIVLFSDVVGQVLNVGGEHHRMILIEFQQLLVVGFPANMDYQKPQQ